MKKSTCFILLILLLAQPCIVFSNKENTIFGNDVPVYNRPDKSENDVSVCCAYNGWLFAAVTYDSLNMQRVHILKSTDGGVHWQLFYDQSIGILNELVDVDIASTGNTDSEFKVIVSMAYHDTITPTGGVMIRTYNGITGAQEQIILNVNESTDMVRSVDIMSDPFSQNPNKVLVIYSQKMVLSGDRLVFNLYEGGESFTQVDQQEFLYTDYFIPEIKIGWGSCPEYPDKYYAVWSGKSDLNSEESHVYASVTSTQGMFQPGVCLDSLYPDMTNRCSHPSIACLNDDIGNSVSNITSVITVTAMNYQGKENEVVGFYNLQSATTSDFIAFTPNSATSNRKDPNLFYDHQNNRFLLTCVDYTTASLPLMEKDLNFSNPDTWNVITPGYNDPGNSINYNPEVFMNYEKDSPAFCWTTDRGNNVALFDAQYSLYNEVNDEIQNLRLALYPNPCKDILNLKIDNVISGSYSIEIINLTGALVKEINTSNYSTSIKTRSIDCSDLKPGLYLIRVRNVNSVSTIRFVKCE